MRRRRVHITRRVGKIGFMGRGMSVPSSGTSDIIHGLGLRLDEGTVSSEMHDRQVHRTDVRVVPAVFGSLFSRTPKAVVRPESAKAVADTLDTCIEEKTYAVAAGANTEGLGGSTPVRGGVVLDVSGLDRILSVDRDSLSVTAEGGCKWAALQDAMAEEGLSLCSYPSSAPASTVAGWLSTGGYGIGTLSAGRFHVGVKALEVAVPSGILVNAGGGRGRYSIWSLAGTEGQMGVITKATLPVKAMPESRAVYGLHADRAQPLLDLAVAVSDLEERPFWLGLFNDRWLTLTGSQATGTGEGIVGVVVVEGSTGEVATFDQAIRHLAAEHRVDASQGDDARAIWESRFGLIHAAEKLNVVLAGEALIASKHLHRLLEGVGEMPGGLELACECHLVDRATALLRLIYPAGWGGPGLTRDVVTTGTLSALALRAGGAPYGIGLWNSTFTRALLGGDYNDLRTIKNETDRLRVLNPGKFFGMTTNSGFPVPGWMYASLLGLARRFHPQTWTRSEEV